MVLKEVPTVDISPYLRGDATGKRTVAKSVDHACSEIGFIVITGHGVPTELIEKVRQVSRKFLSLPFEVKMRYNSPTRGYKPVGSGAFSYSLGIKTPPDIREAFSMGPFDFPDNEYHRKGGDLYAPNVWPTELPEMKEIWYEYFRTMDGLGRRMIRICALALDLPEYWFDDKFDKAAITFLVNYYPPQTEKPVEGQLRGGMHTDYGGITFLHRDNSPGGLQVKTKDGEWVDAPHVPDSFTINIGDLMAQWTNDRWVSTLHRVVNPPWELARETDRMSMPFFFDPNYDAMIEPIKTCCSPNNPPKYERTTAGEHKLMKLQKARLAKAELRV